MFRSRGDSLIARDGGLPRVSVFGPDGAFARSIAMDLLEGRRATMAGLVADTISVVTATVFEPSGGVTRTVRDTMVVAVRLLDGGPTTSLGRFPSTERFDQVRDNDGVSGWDLPFGARLHLAITSGLVWVGQSERYEARGYDPASGALRRIVRLSRAEVPVTQADHDRFLDHRIAAASADVERDLVLGVREVMEFSPTMPAFSDLVGDSEGDLWMREYQPPWTAGRARAVVRIPSALEVHDIGPDYVLGRVRDELDVEHIRLQQAHARLRASGRGARRPSSGREREGSGAEEAPPDGLLRLLRIIDIMFSSRTLG